jgi:hypothetical protein
MMYSTCHLISNRGGDDEDVKVLNIMRILKKGKSSFRRGIFIILD